jgi:hypothetical protein
MKKLYIVIGLLALVPEIAAAADLVEPPCGCRVSSEAKGLVHSASGTVFVSDKIGLVPARAGARFSLPATVLAGPRSSSTIDIGKDCTLSIVENQSLEIERDNASWCVSVIGEPAIPMPMPLPPAFAAAPILPVAAGVTAGAIIFSIAHRDKTVSR